MFVTNYHTLMNREDIKDIASIRLFVNDFYGKIRRDSVLGPIFDEAIQDNRGPHQKKRMPSGMPRRLAFPVSGEILC